MKKVVAMLAGTALMVASSTVANAIPTLTLTNGNSSVTVTGPESSDPAYPSWVAFNGAVGDFKVAITTGISILGTSYMHLNSTDLSINNNSPTVLNIKFSETGFSNVDPTGFRIHFGGVADGTLTYNAYYDTDNILNAKTTAIGGPLTNAGNRDFAASDVGLVNASGLFSITQEVTVNHNRGSHSSSFGAVITPVPEPATMVLLGTGLFGLAIYGKRRRNA